MHQNTQHGTGKPFARRGTTAGGLQKPHRSAGSSMWLLLPPNRGSPPGPPVGACPFNWDVSPGDTVWNTIEAEREGGWPSSIGARLHELRCVSEALRRRVGEGAQALTIPQLPLALKPTHPQCPTQQCLPKCPRRASPPALLLFSRNRDASCPCRAWPAACSRIASYGSNITIRTQNNDVPDSKVCTFPDRVNHRRHTGCHHDS